MVSIVVRHLLLHAAVRSLCQMQNSEAEDESVYFSVHHISWAGPSAGPRKRVGRLMGLVRVVIVVASVHHLSWAVALAGPRNSWATSWAGQSGPYISHISSRDLARPIKFRVDWPRTVAAHQRLQPWAAAQPGPSTFQMMGRGPARLITF